MSTVQNIITILRGRKGLIGLYLDDKLVATHDKFSKPWEVDQCCEQHGGEGCTIVEKPAMFYRFKDIPLVLEADDSKDIPGVVRTLQEIQKSKAVCVGKECPGCSVCSEDEGKGK